MPEQSASYQSLRQATSGMSWQVSQAEWADLMRQPVDAPIRGWARLGPVTAAVAATVVYLLLREEPAGAREVTLYWSVLALTIGVAALQALYLAVCLPLDARFHIACVALGAATPAVFKGAQELFFTLPDVWIAVLIVPGIALMFVTWWTLVPLMLARLLHTGPNCALHADHAEQ